MAGKNLYEILEVARNASPEILSTAYNLQCDRAKAYAQKDPARAAALRAAADEAYHTLSNPQLKGRYDLRLRQPMTVTAVPVATVDDRPWLVRNWVWVSVLIIVVAGTGYYYDKSKRDRIAVERKFAEQKEILDRERAERAAADAAQQAAADERKARIDQAREYAYQQQVRAQARSDSARLQRQEQRDRQLEERQKLTEARKEEAERLRQENDARRNLEREKARLRQLECSRGPC